MSSSVLPLVPELPTLRRGVVVISQSLRGFTTTLDRKTVFDRILRRRVSQFPRATHRRKKNKRACIGRRIGDRMLPDAVVLDRTRLVATFVFIFVFLTVFADSVTNDSQVKCSRTCIAKNCNSVGIRYGKYCGVGWSGCPGEKPCDDLDACCKIHDECVEKKGMINVKCHEKFKSCIKKVKKSGKVGFSRSCPIETAVPTMMQGMDVAILLSRLGGKLDEL